MFVQIHKAHVSTVVHPDSVRASGLRLRTSLLRQEWTSHSKHDTSARSYAECGVSGSLLPAASAAMYSNPLVVEEWRVGKGKIKFLREIRIQGRLLLCYRESPIHTKESAKSYLTCSNWVTGLRSGSAACHHRVINITCHVPPRKISCRERDRSLHNNICSKTHTCVHTKQTPPILLF